MANTQDRVHVPNQKIERDEVRAGDHIYVHEAGGIFNKHGTVYKKENGDMNVVYYDKKSASIASIAVRNSVASSAVITALPREDLAPHIAWIEDLISEKDRRHLSQLRIFL